MKKNRILSALLCLSLAAGLVIPGLPAYAEGEGESSSSGMELSKTAVANDNGTYTITLEAYATGQKVINQVNRDVPTDIILVLDQSGSMAWDMSTVNFGPYDKNTVNSEYYKHRFNDGDENLYYCDDAGVYYPVSVSVVETISYDPITNGRNNYSGAFGESYTNYWENRNNLYALVNGERQKVTLTQVEEGDWWKTTYYVYTLPDRTQIAKSADWYGTPTFTGIDGGVLYLASVDNSKTVYTYTYVVDGNTIVIGTSTGANNTFDKTLYKYGTMSDGSRRDALEKAVKTFAQSVATKAAGADGQLGTEDDINHRLALVGFASKSGDGNNTELLSIAGSNSGDVGVAYKSISNQNLKDVLQNMDTAAGQTMVTKAISALAAEGATRVDLGMDMAQRILEANPVPTGQERNRVVVVFTDGAPTTYDGFDKDVADDAISKANAIKSNGATVYSVGIFPGADPTSSGTEPSGNLDDGSSSIPAASNWFMQRLSSNNGTPQTPSFYLSAADANTLTSIFQQIAQNIESGGTTTTLGESAVIKDIISPQFTLPAGTTVNDITLETYQCTGKNNDVYTWSKNPTAMGANAVVNGDQVSVTGFDFAGNWCGTENNNGTTTYRGNKLVISFDVVTKPGFLGGNNVFTNTSAGVYENANAQNPVLTFDRPQVNVPIKKVTVTPADKNVYLLGTVTAAQLQEGATVKVGDVALDLSKANDADKPYGLETWQNEYVNITVQIKDKDGNVISSDLSALTDDATYTLAVTVSPKTDGTGASGEPNPMIGKSGSDKANIYVYKPELTYKDSEVFYGDAVPTDFDTNNRTATKWKHNDTEADTSTMGPAPALAITYTPDSNKIDDNNKIASTEDIQVAATVEIKSTDVTGKSTDVTGKTTFLHTACAEGVTCGWSETTLDGDPAFLLHVKTATLKITKAGNVGATEGFIFNVSGPQNFRVSVQGNGSVTITGLPLGTYTVTEDEGWSWRYTATGSAKAELTKAKPDGAVTIQNEKDNPYLLDGNDYKQNNFALLSAGN